MKVFSITDIIDKKEWKLYLCEDDETCLDIYKEHGIVEEKPNKYLFVSKEKYNVIIGKVKTICTDTFIQVYMYSNMIGYNLSYYRLHEIFKTLDKYEIYNNSTR